MKKKLVAKGENLLVLYNKYFFSIFLSSWKIDQQAVERSCSVTAQHEGCKESELLGIKGYLCYCKGNKCNLSSSLKPLFPALAILTSVIYVLI